MRLVCSSLCGLIRVLNLMGCIRKPVAVSALALVATGCAHLANVKTTQPGVPRLMVEEEQLQSATEHLARAKHEQPSLSLGDDLSAAKLSLDVLERRPGDLSAQRIYNFSVARVVEDVERANLQPWREPSNIASGQERFRLAAPRPVDAERDPSRYDLLPIDTLKVSGQFSKLVSRFVELARHWLPSVAPKIGSFVSSTNSAAFTHRPPPSSDFRNSERD